MRRAAETLTDRRIAALAPVPGRVVDLHDSAAPGLIFRCRGTGWRGFVFRYTSPAGRRRLIVLGRYGRRPPALSLAAARQRAGELAAELRAGADPLEARERARAAARERDAAERAAQRAAAARARAVASGAPLPGTFADLARVYVRDHARRHKRTWREDLRKLERDLLPAWAARPAGSISRGDVRALVSGIAEGEGRRARPGAPAPAAANRVLALISRLFTFALDVEYPGVLSNPAYRLPRPGPEHARERVLSPEEIRALWVATEAERPIPRAAIRLLLLTGLRRGELLGARWADLVEDELGTWLEVPGERTKTGRPLRAPISSLAVEEMRHLAEVRDRALIFPGVRAGRPLVDLNGPVRRLRARVGEAAVSEPGAPAWTVHDLRRTFRTLLAALRVPFGVAERCLGHVAPDARGVAGVYDRHSYAEERMAAVEALARRVREIVSGERAKLLTFYQRAGEGPPS